MTHKITVQPGGQTCLADNGSTILRAALGAGINLPYGCRNGSCGSCKGRVREGAVDHGEADAKALSEAEKAQGYALFCCARPLSDLVIEARQIDADPTHEVKNLPARVERMQRLAPDVMALFLKLPANERLSFAAGQYIEIICGDGKRRAYSLANAPHDADLLQLHVRLSPGGGFSERVFKEMKERDMLRFEGPLGSFQLDEASSKPIILLAGGTGFAPIKSIMEHLLRLGKDRRVSLYWGARDRAGLYLPELPQRWSAESGVRYVPVLSDPLPGDAWDGRCGLVHEAVLADIDDLRGHQVYAAGSPAMVVSAQRDFVARGLPAEAFFADAFNFAASP